MWRHGVRLIKVAAQSRSSWSPFATFEDAEAACDAMLKHLTSD
jgi:hypothetical protein